MPTRTRMYGAPAKQPQISALDALAAAWPYQFPRERAVNANTLLHKLAAPQRYAFVRVMDGKDGRLKLPHQASLFALHQRLLETGAARHADQVLVHCAGGEPLKTHPAYTVVPLSCNAIDDALSGKDLLANVFYKLLAWQLVHYTRVLVLDIDVHVVGDMLGIFRYEAPATVRWESATNQPYQANGGVVLLRPSVEMFKAALRWLRRLPNGTKRSRLFALRGMRTPWGAWNNKTGPAKPADPGPVCVEDGEQQFVFVFFNVLERARFGPLHELPFAYNVKHYTLTDFAWSALAFLTFMSRLDQGHVRAVHFNRDKPWNGAQCGPFHRPFWQAAWRAVNALDNASAFGQLAFFVREGLRHEEATPCVKGMFTRGALVRTLHNEQRQKTGGSTRRDRDGVTVEYHSETFGQLVTAKMRMLRAKRTQEGRRTMKEFKGL